MTPPTPDTADFGLALHSRHLPMPKGLPPHWNELTWHWFREAQEAQEREEADRIRCLTARVEALEAYFCNCHTRPHHKFCDITEALAAKEKP